MKIEELKEIRKNLGKFLKEFDACIKTAPSREHFRTYIRGQVSALERKNVEQIALDADIPPRTLLEFLEFYLWGDEKVRRRVQEVIMRDHADENAVAVVDETGNPKKGDKTAGVEPQYCGATGKIDNCVVLVNLVYATEDFHALADGDLFLPEETWGQDRARCRAAGIPDAVAYRPKWRIALDLLRRALDHGMRFRFLTADEEYGRCAEFRRAVAEWGLTYVVEVPCSTAGWVKKPRLAAPEAYAGPGRPATRTLLAPDAKPARRADKLWCRGGPQWTTYHVKETEKGPAVWEVRATRFWAAEDGLPAGEGWLLVARNVLDGEVKYFLANAPADTPVETLLHVAFSRWHVERAFEDAKGEVGLDHFEVRKYRPLMRHLILSMVSLLFLMRETRRLREKKSVVESDPGAARGRSAA